MNTFDPGGMEFLRMAEHYRQMSDDELLVLIPQSSELTPFAQEALANEVRSRGLKAEVVDEKPVTSPPPAFFEHGSPELRDSADYDPDSSYDEDRKLVELCTVWSVRDALQLQTILDDAGIPFFMGKENATGVDRVTSNFSNGVSVQIMQIGMPWARQAMQRYEPEDDPTPKEKEEPGELMVRCPQCHSAEVVFEGLTSAPETATDESSQKYQWTCDSCGYHWLDDGVEKEE
jgi:DNA-directed RNA polymerase subunit M/transcription elongation factor TFIIS